MRKEGQLLLAQNQFAEISVGFLPKAQRTIGAELKLVSTLQNGAIFGNNVVKNKRGSLLLKHTFGCGAVGKKMRRGGKVFPGKYHFNQRCVLPVLVIISDVVAIPIAFVCPRHTG